MAKRKRVYTGLDPGDGRPRYATVFVEEGKKDPHREEIPVPTVDELPVFDQKTGQAATELRPSDDSREITFVGHVEKALAEAEERREAMWEQYSKGRSKER